MKSWYEIKYTPLFVNIRKVSDAPPATPGRRGEIGCFSEDSARRLKAYLTSSEACYSVMATFTLPEEAPIARQPEEFKARLDDFLAYYLQQLRMESVNPKAESVCWFLEFTAKGIPHVHCFATGFVNWLVLAVKWCLVMGCPEAIETCSKVERMGGGRRQVRRYAVKYASKGLGANVGDLAVELGIPVQGYDDLALWGVVVANLKQRGDKRYQKLVPPWVRGFGRWWGVRGLKASMAAAIKVPYNDKGRQMVIKFLDALLNSKGFKPETVKKITRENDQSMLLVPIEGQWDSRQTANICLAMTVLGLRQ